MKLNRIFEYKHAMCSTSRGRRTSKWGSSIALSTQYWITEMGSTSGSCVERKDWQTWAGLRTALTACSTAVNSFYWDDASHSDLQVWDAMDMNPRSMTHTSQNIDDRKCCSALGNSGLDMVLVITPWEGVPEVVESSKFWNSLHSSQVAAVYEEECTCHANHTYINYTVMSNTQPM